MKFKRFIYSLSFIACCALLCQSCFNDGETGDVKEYVKVGDPVPAFTTLGEIKDYDSSETAGKITLIAFFDPECGDCQRELPLLQYVWGNLDEEPYFEMVNIARGRTLENLGGATNGNLWLSMPCYPDPARTIYNLFANQTIPRIYLIDQEGIVRKMWVENTHMNKEQFLAAVKSYVEAL